MSRPVTFNFSLWLNRLMPVRSSEIVRCGRSIDMTADSEIDSRSHIAADEPTSVVMPAGEREIRASRCGERVNALSAPNAPDQRP